MLLQNGVYPKTNNFFSYSSKCQIKTYINTLLNRLFTNTDVKNEGVVLEHEDFSDTDSAEIEKNEDFYQKLQKYIGSFNKPNNDEKSDMVIENDIKILVATAKRTDRLELLYQAMLTVKPTSTSSERVFSTAGNFATKLRNSMRPKLLDHLVFLKYYFANN